jgi:hypothetical protein
MLSIGLWRWYSNIIISVLDIIRRPVFYLKHQVSNTEFCLCLQVEPTEMGLLSGQQEHQQGLYNLHDINQKTTANIYTPWISTHVSPNL